MPNEFETAATTMIKIARNAVLGETNAAADNAALSQRAAQAINSAMASARAAYTRVTGTNLKARDAAEKAFVFTGAVLTGVFLAGTPAGWAILIAAGTTAGAYAASKTVQELVAWHGGYDAVYQRFVAAQGAAILRDEGQVQYLGRKLKELLPVLAKRLQALEEAIRKFNQSYTQPLGANNTPETLATWLAITERRSRELNETLEPFRAVLNWISDEVAALGLTTDLFVSQRFLDFSQWLQDPAKHTRCASYVDNEGLQLKCCYQLTASGPANPLVNTIWSLTAQQRTPFVRMTNDAAHWAMHGQVLSQFHSYEDHGTYIHLTGMAPFPRARRWYRALRENPNATAGTGLLLRGASGPGGLEELERTEGAGEEGKGAATAQVAKIVAKALPKAFTEGLDAEAFAKIREGGVETAVEVVAAVVKRIADNCNYNWEREAYHQLQPNQWAERAMRLKNMLQSSSEMETAFLALGRISSIVHGDLDADSFWKQIRKCSDCRCQVIFWYTYNALRVGKYFVVLMGSRATFDELGKLARQVSEEFSLHSMVERERQVIAKISAFLVAQDRPAGYL